jgi:Na+/phosphate symporter
MDQKDIKKFFLKVSKLNLTSKEKERMMRLFQVKDSAGKIKALSYSGLKKLLKEKNGNITHLVLGPDWNRIVFVDIDVEV